MCIRDRFQQGPVVLAAAVSQLVGDVYKRQEEQRTVTHWLRSSHLAPVRAPRSRHPGTATRTVPTSTRATQPSCGTSGFPLTAAASRAVMTAPMTRAAVTSTAGARERAANHVET